MDKECVMTNNKMKAKLKQAPKKAIGKQPSLKQIILKLHRHLPELRRRYKVNYLGVFGSYVHGEQRKRSDLDILVEIGDSSMSLFRFIELQFHLSDILGLKVDLVEKTGLKPAIGRHILEEAVSV
jgi:predicted nucleotidyltransferase